MNLAKVSKILKLALGTNLMEVGKNLDLAISMSHLTTSRFSTPFGAQDVANRIKRQEVKMKGHK